MFIERSGKRGREPQYLICYPSVTDVGDRSILIDNLRAIEAGEVDVEPTVYHSPSGSSEFIEVECKTSLIDDQPGRRETRVKTLQGDLVDELEWWIEGAGSPKKAGKRKIGKKPWRPKATFYLLAEVFPLPGGERRFTPIGIFFKLAKAQDWAQEMTKDYEQSASQFDDPPHPLEFCWSTDKKTGEMSLRTSINGMGVGIVQFIIQGIPCDPALRDTYNEIRAVAAERARAAGDEKSALDIEASKKGRRRVHRGD